MKSAHRGSPCIHTAFTPLLQVVCGECLKEWGEVHGNENKRRWRRIAQQKGPECEIPHLTR